MIRIPRVSSLLLIGALALGAPTSADAQFGGLIKKAQEKAGQKAEEKLGPVSPGEQLTEELLGKVVAGATAADRVLGDRDRVQTTREAKNKELSELTDKNQPVHRAYNEANDKILNCRSASLSSLSDAREERNKKQLERLQSDPAFMGKMQLVGMKYAKAMSEAHQKNDAMALQKAQQEMMKELLGEDIFADMKKDSIATDSKCGKVPAKPAALMQEERLQKELSVADDSIRTLEAKAVNVGAQASGIEQVRYLQLKERALAILNRLGGQGSAKFGEVELEAVRKRQADLEKVKRAL